MIHVCTGDERYGRAEDETDDRAGEREGETRVRYQTTHHQQSTCDSFVSALLLLPIAVVSANERES